jgi:hypothetical protein
VAEEAPTKGVAGELKATPLGLDGKPLTKNSVSLWRQVPSNAADKSLWNDRTTGKSWKPINGFATSGPSTFEKLKPGTYRVSVREGHDQADALGVSAPIVIDPAHQRVSAKVQLIAGGNLQLTCVDAENGGAIPPPYIKLQSNDDSFWKDDQFQADAVAGQPGLFEFRNLPAGKYRLHAARSATHPNDVKYELADGDLDVSIEPQQTVSRDLKFRKAKLTPQEVTDGWPFEVYGKVTDKNGNPVADAVVRAHTGEGTMFQTGAAETDSNGRYHLNFALGGMQRGEGASLAIIAASKPGMAERNLNRQGEIAVAYKRSTEKSDWLEKLPLVLAKEPREINFTLAPAGTLSVRVHREDRDEVDGLSISLKGHAMPPGCSVIDSGRTDKWGEITFAEVPLDQEWWIEIERGDRAVRTQPFKLTQPQRYDLSLDSRSDKTGIEVLEITRINDALGRDQTLKLVGARRMHVE